MGVLPGSVNTPLEVQNDFVGDDYFKRKERRIKQAKATSELISE